MISAWNKFAGLLLMLLIQGCMQPNVLQLTRVEPPGGTAESGTRTEKDSVEVSLHYNGLSYGNYDFTLTIQNRSADTVFIGPRDCSYIPTFGPPRQGGLDTAAAIPAIDPERQIAWLSERKITEEMATNPYNGLVNALVTGILESMLNSKEEQEKAAEERKRKSAEWEKEHLENLYNLTNQIEFWRVTAMGNVFIVPGRTFSGRILFTVRSEANGLRVRIRLNGVVRQIGFHQQPGRR